MATATWQFLDLKLGRFVTKINLLPFPVQALFIGERIEIFQPQGLGGGVGPAGDKEVRRVPVRIHKKATPY
jgi:hypothetical protein